MQAWPADVQPHFLKHHSVPNHENAESMMKPFNTGRLRPVGLPDSASSEVVSAERKTTQRRSGETARDMGADMIATGRTTANTNLHGLRRRLTSRERPLPTLPFNDVRDQHGNRRSRLPSVHVWSRLCLRTISERDKALLHRTPLHPRRYGGPWPVDAAKNNQSGVQWQR